MTRIAFLIPTVDHIGGAECQVLLLAKGFARRNWRVSVITLSGTGGEAAANLRSEGIEFLSLHMCKGLADPRGWIRLFRWINLHKPDVVHAHLPHAVLMARLSRLIAPLRVLVETVHSPVTGNWQRKSAYRLTANQPDAISAVSLASADPWVAQRIIGQSHLAIIPNGIDLDRWKCDASFRHTGRQHLGFRDEFVWLAVGRLHPVKDHATLLRAFTKLPESTRLLIVGAGPLDSALRSAAAGLGIEKRVVFAGFQNDVLPWIQAADAFVLCSQWEGLPMAVLEAAACGLPAVFTDIPAIRELFPEQSERHMVSAGDSKALAAAMMSLMENPESDRRALGQALRKTVVARFSLTSVLDQWEQTYCSLLAIKPCATRSGGRSYLSEAEASSSSTRKSPAC